MRALLALGALLMLLLAGCSTVHAVLDAECVQNCNGIGDSAGRGECVNRCPAHDPVVK